MWCADGSASTLAANTRDLAWQAGEGQASWGRPLLDEAARDAAIRSATEAVFRVVDLAGLDRQAVAATQAAARSRGTGPLGRVTSFIYRASGRQTAVADPTRFLLGWRDRGGGVGSAVESIRDAISAPIRDAPPALRSAVAASLDTFPDSGRSRARARSRDRKRGLARATDESLWPVIGLLQTLATVGIALSTAWVVLWVLVRPVTGSVELPLLGPVPSPFVALAGFLLAGYLLARLLGAHARWLGSRWGVRVRDRVAHAIDLEVRQRAFRQLDALEGARRRLAESLVHIEQSCGRRG